MSKGSSEWWTQRRSTSGNEAGENVWDDPPAPPPPYSSARFTSSDTATPWSTYPVANTSPPRPPPPPRPRTASSPTWGKWGMASEPTSRASSPFSGCRSPYDTNEGRPGVPPPPPRPKSSGEPRPSAGSSTCAAQLTPVPEDDDDEKVDDNIRNAPMLGSASIVAASANPSEKNGFDAQDVAMRNFLTSENTVNNSRTET